MDLIEVLFFEIPVSFIFHPPIDPDIEEIIPFILALDAVSDP
jgi:hypothetical protein